MFAEQPGVPRCYPGILTAMASRMKGTHSRDWLDYHDPTAGVGGAPPARSSLGFRLALAIFGLLICTAGAVAFALVGAPVWAGILGALAAIALVDIGQVVRRMRRERAAETLHQEDSRS
jgi:hypothetical protein